MSNLSRFLISGRFQRTSIGLLQKDRVTLAMLLAQASAYQIDNSLIARILDEEMAGIDVSTETNRRNEVMVRAGSLPIFKDRIQTVNSGEWDKFLEEENAEDYVPQIWDLRLPELDKQLHKLLVIKLFRLDRFVPAAEQFVAVVFGKEILDTTGDLREIVSQVSATTPIALASSPGFDASYKVEGLVEQMKINCANIAMGSVEGLATADKAVGNAASSGSWVLVKNVHLTPGWLQSLEKRLDAFRPHPNFRLFLSMETSPKIPINLLRTSRVLMYEQPAGVRANMKDSLSSLSMRPTRQQPAEKARVYLLLSFLHAVVQERLRYVPNLGWKGFWEFNDSDVSFLVDLEVTRF